MTEFHPEILSSQQAAILPGLARAVAEQSFYLAGGTAVALRLGHRRSVDFDWFRVDEIRDPLAFAAGLRTRGLSIDVVQTQKSTLHAVVAGVKTSFLSFPYPLVTPVETWPETGCPVASLEDLACMKLAAIGQRGARRDFVDLHAILGSGHSLAGLLDIYRRKFAVSDAGHLLVALTYFDDARREPMPATLAPLNWGLLEDDLRRAVRDAVG